MNNNNNRSGFYLLSDNSDAFVARLTLAAIAKETLDIQYYIIHNDASGQHLAYALLSAADRGVHVRVMVDDINLSGSDNRLKMLSQHDNIEIRIFNPFTNRDWFRNIELIINLDRAGRRMHNKVFMCDNNMAIIGGRNIGDEYFDARHSLNFVDLDILTVGPIVSEISTSFEDYWKSHWATPIEVLSKTKVVKKQLATIRNRLKDKWHHAKNLKYFKSLDRLELTQNITNKKINYIWAEAKLFYDCPDKLCNITENKTIHFGPHILRYFEQATSELLIASPYFVPGMFGTQWLTKKSSQGVQLNILTNSLAATDVIAVHAGYKKYRHQLLKAGISLFELKPTAKPFILSTKKLIEGSSMASLHAKYMVVDNRYVFIGSANLDPRSGNLNTEIGIMIDSTELANQAGELFNKTISPENSYQISLDKSGNNVTWQTNENGKAIHYTSEPDAGILRKTGVFILSMLPIESLL